MPNEMQDSAVAGAKAELGKAKELTKSVEGSEHSRFAPATHPEYSYKQSAKPASSEHTGLEGEAKDAAKGIADTQRNVQEYEETK